MTKDKNDAAEAARLRSRAKGHLRAKTTQTHSPRTEIKSQRLLHELEVHRIELEMQNAQLRQARDDAETALGKYSDLYDFAPSGYFTLDRKGNIRAANITGAELIGVERSRLIGRLFGLFVADAHRTPFTAFLGKVFATHANESCEVKLLQEGKTPLFVRIEAVAAASGIECRIAMINITELKQAEESLRRAKEGAEAANRAKSQFLANMSHELRTPMTGILGMLQFALEEELAPTPRDYLKATLTSARSLLRVLNDILIMTEIEAGKLTIEEKPFSFPMCIAAVVDIITPEVRRKGLDFALSLAEETPETVVGDELRLRQVLLNLIGNAVKFTEKGKVELLVTADATTADGKRKFTFVVRDTGIGIPGGKLNLLFRPFSQVDDSHTRSYGGTGVGLAISREIVELMGGTITCASEVGWGAPSPSPCPWEKPERRAISSSLPISCHPKPQLPPRREKGLSGSFMRKMIRSSRGSSG
jgi:PAS domain S-box-containing protein